MAEGRSIGTIFVELDLDPSRYTKGQQTLLKDATSTSLSIEENFKKLNIKSSAEFDLLRQKASNAFDQIKNSAEATANDIVRAEQAKNDKLADLNTKQFGVQKTFLDGIKQNWLAASAAIVGAWALVNKAVEYMDEGAAAMRIESSFKIMAEAAGDSADRIITSMKAATKETIDDSVLMEKATKLMTLGFNPEEIERFSGVVITASQIAGVTAVEAFDKLGDAIGNRTPKALMQLGAVTKDQMDIVNEAISAGATTMDVYGLAMANLELKQKMLQGTQDEASIALQKFHTQIGELKENIGKGLIVVVDLAYRGFQYLAAGVLYALGGFFKFQAFLEKYIGTQEGANYQREQGNIAFAAAKDLMDKAGKSITEESKIEARATKDELAGAKSVVDARLKDLASLKVIADQKIKDEASAKQYAREEEKRMDQAEKDRIAEIKLIEKVGMAQIEAYGDYEDLNASRDKLEKQRQEKMEVYAAKELERAETLAKDRAEVAVKLYADLDSYASENFDAKVALLDLEYEQYAKLGVDEGLLMDAYAARWKTLHDELILSTGTFADGLQLGLDRATENLITWAEVGVGLVGAFKTNAQSALSGFLSDALSGDIQKFSTYWNTFKDAMIKTFADMLAQLAIDWAASEIKNILSENTGGIINTAITWGKKLFGGDDYDLYHEGGLVGKTLPHPPSPEDKLAYDEYLAVLQAGEYVMTGDEYKRYKAFMSFIDVLAKSGPGGGNAPGGMPSAVDTGLVSQSTADFVEAVFAKGILGWKGVVDPDTGKTSYVPQPMSLFNIMPFLTDLPQTIIMALLDETLAQIGVQKPTITSLLDYVLEAVGLGPQGSSGNIGSGFAFGTGEYGGYEGAMGGYGGVVGGGYDSMGYATGGIVSTTGKALVHAGEGVFTPEQMKYLQPFAPDQRNQVNALYEERGELLKVHARIVRDINRYQELGLEAGRSQDWALFNDIKAKIAMFADESNTVTKTLVSLERDIESFIPKFTGIIGDAVQHTIEKPQPGLKPTIDAPINTTDKTKCEIVITVPVYIDGKEVSRTVYDGMYDASTRGEITIHPRAIVGYTNTIGLAVSV